MKVVVPGPLHLSHLISFCLVPLSPYKAVWGIHGKLGVMGAITQCILKTSYISAGVALDAGIGVTGILD
jgi:hypothetical protein